MSANTRQAAKSILVVDDEADVRQVLKAILTSSGYSVTEARDGQEAIDLLAEKKFDLMTLDLTMLRLTGEEVLEQLRLQERLKEMSTIILTAKSRRKDVKEKYEQDVAFYVVKTFNNATIRDLPDTSWKT